LGLLGRFRCAVFNGGFQVAFPAAGNFIWSIALPSGLVITDGAGILQLRVDGNTTS
jgi:hypothetical protein